MANSQLADHSAVQNRQQPVSRLMYQYMYVDVSMYKSWKRFEIPFQNLCHGLHIPTRHARWVICATLSVNFVFPSQHSGHNLTRGFSEGMRLIRHVHTHLISCHASLLKWWGEPRNGGGQSISGQRKLVAAPPRVSPAMCRLPCVACSTARVACHVSPAPLRVSPTRVTWQPLNHRQWI